MLLNTFTPRRARFEEPEERASCRIEMDSMMRRAGYVRLSRCAAVDGTGAPCQIVELTIDGCPFGIREPELRRVLTTWLSARVEPLRQNWGQHLDGVAGYAERSQSGNAVMVELLTGRRFTIPAAALRAVLARSRAFASVSEILTPPPQSRPVAQQHLPVGG
jgi:hypothetical protein